jgi:ubiquinone/menaquinone biosynthesis C-methylase UbiE
VDYERYYRDSAREYDRLVAAEDCDGNLLAALAARLPLAGARVLEVGAGTGRILRLLAGAGARVAGFDRAPAMLAIARAHIRDERLDAAVALADAVALPVRGGWADAAVAGWVFGHLRSWLPDGWRDAVARGLAEMRRACRPGAPCIVIETLGTGEASPRAPTAALAEYYAWLEDEQGFARAAIRTDYRFATVDEAAEVTGHFFGEELAARVRSEGWTRVPEHTGVWTRPG